MDGRIMRRGHNFDHFCPCHGGFCLARSCVLIVSESILFIWRAIFFGIVLAFYVAHFSGSGIEVGLHGGV